MTNYEINIDNILKIGSLYTVNFAYYSFEPVFYKIINNKVNTSTRGVYFVKNIPILLLKIIGHVNSSTVTCHFLYGDCQYETQVPILKLGYIFTEVNLI